jgi:CzcA family heavy metal efflux pump
MKHFYTNHKHSITFILIMIVMGGIFSFTRIKTSLFPEITFPKIKVIVDNGQQPVEKMLVTITKPLETAIKQVHDVKMVQSITSRGECEISAYMDWKADMDMGQQMIESKIGEIRNILPPNTDITVIKMNPSALAVMGYTLESDVKSPIELKLIANNLVRPFLSQVDGVASVKVIGGKTKEYWVMPDIRKMGTLGITPDTINTILSQTNFINSNGYTSDYRRLYLTLTDAGIYNKEDLENVVIKNDEKRILLLKDIATIEIKEQVEYTKINANGKEALLLNVFRQPNANLLDVSNDMVDKIKELTKILPPKVYIKPYYIQADFVNTTIKSVSDSLWIGLLLAIVVAVIFLRSWKASLTILLTIPLTLGLTLIVLYALGYTFNIMTLGAVAAAIALIIDDAIVVTEQIHRTHEEYPNERSSILVIKSIKFLFPSMLGSSLSTIVIFVPFFLMGGVAGAYFNVLTNTMIITLICSFLVTWIGLPVIYLILSKREKIVGGIDEETIAPQFIEHSEDIPEHLLNKGWISFFVTKPILSILFVGGLIVAVYIIYPKLETGFLPDMDEGSIVLDYKSPPGTSLEETDRMLSEVEKLIVKVPEVEAYSRRTGTEMGFFLTEPNRGDYLIQLKKDRKRTTDEVIADIRKQVESTQPALTIDFGQIIGDMLGDLMSSVQPVEIKIFGPNQDSLTNLALKVEKIVDSTKGTADVFNGITIAGPYVNVKPDYVKLAQYNIPPNNFQFQLQTQLEGNVIGTILENQQLTNIRMVYPDSKSNSLKDIKNQFVFIPGGKLKPFSEFGTYNIKPGVAEIKRENLENMVAVTARLDNRDLGSVMKDIKKQIKDSLNVPGGYHITYGGAYAQQEQSFRELLMILISASLLVFAVIIFLFRDYKVAILIFFIALLGTSGSVLALFITGTPLNVGSYTGIIMIVGIIGENAIFTFQQFITTRKRITSDSRTKQAIIYAISVRLRPKLMTAIGAIIALLPLALGIGTGAQLHQPLAIAVIGGFVIALPLLLIVFPTLLNLVYRK